MDLKEFIRSVPDFPKAGIDFKDITPLLNDPMASEECLRLLLHNLSDIKIDKVAAIESRGFFFGTLLAQRLRAGFVPIRKPNKLPFDTLSASYALEYGRDTLQMHVDAINKGDKVLIHDDVLATGGTANAACELIENAGGIIVQCNFLMELTFLNGRQKIQRHPTYSAVIY